MLSRAHELHLRPASTVSMQCAWMKDLCLPISSLHAYFNLHTTDVAIFKLTDAISRVSISQVFLRRISSVSALDGSECRLKARLDERATCAYACTQRYSELRLNSRFAQCTRTRIRMRTSIAALPIGVQAVTRQASATCLLRTRRVDACTRFGWASGVGWEYARG